MSNDKAALEPWMQEVVCDFPPLYDEIAAVFRIHERRDVVFSFGSIMYNPYALPLPDEIVVHEAVHGDRQGRGDKVLDWWKRYMEDPAFRLTEEVYAHRAEYRWLLGHGNRKQRRQACKRVAGRLASPTYGRLTTTKKASRLLKADSYSG